MMGLTKKCDRIQQVYVNALRDSAFFYYICMFCTLNT